MQKGINSDHYAEVVKSRIEHDLPVGGINVFVAQRIEPNEPEQEDVIIDRDCGDEQPSDNIEFRKVEPNKVLSNLFQSFGQIF